MISLWMRLLHRGLCSAGFGMLLASSAVAGEMPDEVSSDSSEEQGEAHVREGRDLDQKTLDEAERLFFEGLEHYRNDRFEEAAVAFQKAYVLTEHRDLLFNVARARERLGDKESAIRWYRAYLATTPSDEVAIIHRVRQLGGDPTPATPPIDPGSDSDEQQYVVDGPGPWPWVALGVAAAAGGAGAWFGLKALDDAQAARDASQRDAASAFKSDAESAALVADVGLGVGVAALGVATYLWWVAEDGAHPSNARIDIFPNGGAALSLGGCF